MDGLWRISNPPCRAIVVGYDEAVADPDDAPGASGHFGVVGDDDDSVALGVQPFEDGQDFVARDRVQRAGRLVGQNDGWIGGDGAGDGHALLLAAR